MRVRCKNDGMKARNAVINNRVRKDETMIECSQMVSNILNYFSETPYM